MMMGVTLMSTCMLHLDVWAPTMLRRKTRASRREREKGQASDVDQPVPVRGDRQTATHPASITMHLYQHAPHVKGAVKKGEDQPAYEGSVQTRKGEMSQAATLDCDRHAAQMEGDTKGDNGAGETASQ